jgi:nicotinamidase-related amidase
MKKNVTSERSSFNYERLTTDKVGLILIDFQVGLMNMVHEMSLPEFKTNVKALISIGKLFNLPTIITTNRANGPHGSLHPHIKESFPKARIIDRDGEINSWDNDDFKKAVKDLGVNRFIIAGMGLGTCTGLPALSLKNEGFDVFVVFDCSGSFTKIESKINFVRLTEAGIIPVNWFAVGCELLGDLRDDKGNEFLKLMEKHMPYYGNLLENYRTLSVEEKVPVSKTLEKGQVYRKPDIKSTERTF